jgi:hypothetical protein
MVRYSVMGPPARIFWALHLAAVRLLGVHASSAEWPGNPGSDGASPYHLERRSMLKTILLVLVVLVLEKASDYFGRLFSA